MRGMAPCSVHVLKSSLETGVDVRRKASQRTLFLLCGRGEGVRSLNEPKSQPNKPGGRARKKRKGVGEKAQGVWGGGGC